MGAKKFPGATSMRGAVNNAFQSCIPDAVVRSPKDWALGKQNFILSSPNGWRGKVNIWKVKERFYAEVLQ